MQFYFIRHAQSENNLLWARTGSSDGRSEDPGLTAVGRQQAHLLARFLRGPDLPPIPQQAGDAQNVAGFGFTHLYCSLMLRSVATGTIVARALDLPLVAWKDIHESGGIYHRDPETEELIGLPGRNRAYFEAHYPDLVLPDSLGDEGWWNRPFEEREERPLRARRFLGQLLERHGHTEDRVAVISHGGFYTHFMKVLLNLPEQNHVWFSMNNVAITRIDFHDQDPGFEHIAVTFANRVEHLPKELIT
jgi:2,3-bisphosphoglycerate-dependent phosphoglycerate mutase